MLSEAAYVLVALLCAHALCDFALQSDAMARGKARSSAPGPVPWWAWLCSHSMIHAGAVLAVTGSPVLAACEAVAHGLTDFLKCEKLISFGEDQAVHAACKIAWTVLTVI